MNFLRVTVVVLALLLASPVSAVETFTGGFVRSSLWVSKKPLYDRASVKIYAALFNPDARDLRGTVEFYVNGVSVGKTPFSLVSGGTQVVWAPWTAKAGKNILSAKIIDAVLSSSDGREDVLVLDSGPEDQITEVVVEDPGRVLLKTDTEKGAASALAPISSTVKKVLGASTTVATFTDTLLSTAAAVYAAGDAVLVDLQASLEDQKDSLEKHTGTTSPSIVTAASTQPQEEGVASYIPTIPSAFNAVGVFFLSTGAFILEHRPVLYILIALAGYMLFRFFFRRY